MPTKEEITERSQTAETPQARKYWFRRLMKMSGIERPIKWAARTTRKPKTDKEYAAAFAKLSGVFGKMPEDDKERLSMAYKAYHNGQITRRQARKLGCNIK